MMPSVTVGSYRFMASNAMWPLHGPVGSIEIDPGCLCSTLHFVGQLRDAEKVELNGGPDNAKYDD